MDNMNTVNSSVVGGSTKSIYLKLYVAIACLMAGLVLGGIIYAMDKYKMGISMERGRHLEQITEKISEITNIDIKNKWNYTLSISNVAVRANVKNKDQLVAAMKEAATRMGIKDIIFAAFDNQGNIYYSNGSQGKWKDNKDFFSSCKDNRKVFIKSLDNLKMDTPQILFVRKIPNKIELDNNVVITYVAYIQPIERFVQQLGIDYYSNKYIMQIIDKQGDIVYSYNRINEIPNKNNIDDVLENSKFLDGGSLKEYKKNIENRQLTNKKFNYKDKEYYMSYAPLDMEEWGVLHVLPAEYANSDTEQYVNIASFAIIGVAVGVIILIIISGGLMTKLRKNHYVMKIQQETNKVLVKAAEEANYANEAKSIFLAHMSHDIRTPINGIVGMTSIAKNYIDDKQRVSDCLNKIEISSKYLMSIINDVLDMSCIEHGKVNLKYNPIDLKEIYNQCIAVIEQQAKENNITLKGNISNLEHQHIMSDELHLKQILINILGNALKFTPEGGEITFNIEEIEDDGKKGKYRFVIADTGIGMSKEYQEHIFECFSQEEKDSRTQYKGTGLGMAIAKNNIDMMKGIISIESELGKGSTFTIELDLEIAKVLNKTDISEVNYNLEGKKILVAEDNELNMEIISTMLEIEGMVVAQAFNGREALEMYKESENNEYKVILMDIMMPEMSGLDVTKEIRKLSREDAKDVKIIAMTANAYEHDEKKSIAAGMNKHMIKPIDSTELFSTLSEYYKK